VSAIAQAYPEAVVEVWATDEHRVGLKPIVGTVWARKGERPRVRVQHRFKWIYVLAFVHPRSGRSEWQFASGINTAVMSVALEYFARAVGAGPAKRVVLVLDQAGFHVSPLVQVPEGIHLVFLPPYSPELQPAEHLWRFSDEPLVNAHFATIDELEDAQADHCDRLQRQPDVIRSATLFHWWPAD
jgi:DDE superfamily endonuclease